MIQRITDTVDANPLSHLKPLIDSSDLLKLPDQEAIPNPGRAAWQVPIHPASRAKDETQFFDTVEVDEATPL